MEGIKIRFENESLMPITNVSIESGEVQELSQMMRLALETIEIAQDYNGRLLSREPENSRRVGISIKYAICFPSKEEQKEFIEDLTEPLF